MKRHRENGKFHEFQKLQKVKSRKCSQLMSVILSNLNLNFETPSIIMHQALHEKKELLLLFKNSLCNTLYYTKTLTEIQFDIRCLSYLTMPILVVLFGPSDHQWIYSLLSQLPINLYILAISPTNAEFELANVKIVKDENGNITRQLGLLCPLGGGIYPIPSFIFFNNGVEVCRLRIPYDIEHYKQGLLSTLNSIITYLTK